MNFQIFITRLISLDACFLSLSVPFTKAGNCLTKKQWCQISWCFNHVWLVATLQGFFFSSWCDCRFHQQVLCCFLVIFFPKGKVALQSSPPSLQIPPKSWNLMHPTKAVKASVVRFGFLHWHVLLWLKMNFLFSLLLSQNLYKCSSVQC